jgi:enoyl-CoA hydratase/carnithine racemase
VEAAEFAEIDYGVDKGVALITLNQPQRRNAWGGRMSVEYRWALHLAHTDPEVRVAVLTGAGDDFCVGAHRATLEDIDRRGGSYDKERLTLPPIPDGVPAGLRHNHTIPLALSVPLIAAVNGACAGAGFVLATYADLRFGADDSRIATSFANLGLPAEYGIGWLLPRMLGTARAATLLYSGSRIDAEEALRLGWLQRVVPSGDLLEETLRYAGRLARHSSPESLRMMKRQIFVDAWGDLEDAYRLSVDEMNVAMTHPDFQEGVAALGGRRDPVFLARTEPGAETRDPGTNAPRPDSNTEGESVR